MTPEAKVKNKVHKALAKRKAYAVNYIGGLYANTGTPDVLACIDSRFIGIEVKAGKNKPTEIQISNLRKIHAAQGLALVINESNLDYLEECLDDIHTARSNHELFAKTQAEADKEQRARDKRKAAQAASVREED